MFLRRTKHKHTIRDHIFHLLMGFLVWGIFIYVIILLYVAHHVYKNNPKPADAVIVLGAASFWQDHQYNPCLVARVQQGVDLYRLGYAHKLLFSGGDDKYDGKANESRTMEAIAEKMGVPAKDIIKEARSTSTYENFLFSEQIMKDNNIQSLIIVTEPFHSPRADLIATHLGIPHTVSPAINSPCWQTWKYFSRYFFREPFAMIYYKLRGRI